MIELLQVNQIGWLGQQITVPLWGFIIALILPVAYFASIAKKRINKHLNGIEDHE